MSAQEIPVDGITVEFVDDPKVVAEEFFSISNGGAGFRVLDGKYGPQDDEGAPDGSG